MKKLMKRCKNIILVSFLLVFIVAGTSCERSDSNADVTHPQVAVEMQDGGKMIFELYPEYAPETVANFISLARSGFYDGINFHRIDGNFMIQGGDPKGDGTGGSDKAIKGEFTENGFKKNTLSHTRGVISMARKEAFDSATSQFFIMVDDDDSDTLDGKYAAFGKLIEGEETLDAIAATPVIFSEVTGFNDKPVKDNIIKTITVLSE